jgi:hypothetical protein
MARSRRRIGWFDYATEMLEWDHTARRIYEELRDLAHRAGPGGGPDPAMLDRLTLLGLHLQWNERQALMLLRGDEDPAGGSKDDRDRLVYDLVSEGRLTHEAVRRQVHTLGKDRGWTPIGTKEGVSRIARDYAVRNGLPPPPPRRPGRRKPT